MSRNARNGEFGNFDEISPKINIRGKMAILTKFCQRTIELEIGVPAKAAILTNPANFFENGDFDEISPNSD